MTGSGGPWDDVAATAGGTAAPAPAASPVTPSTKAVTCPNCGGTVDIRAAGYSVTVACQYCGSVLDVANPDVAIIERHNQAVADLALPLGSKGWVKGNEYQLVGYVRRSIDGEGWDEYLLFNPYVGYRWLVHDENGWTFGTMLTSLPSVSGNSAQYAGVRFTSDGEQWYAVVDRVVGEFYWRVRIGDQAMLSNYESYGATLSCERVADEVNWTVSETIGAGEMRGFGKTESAGDAPASAENTGRSRFADGIGPAVDYGHVDHAGPFARAWAYMRMAAVAVAIMIVTMVLFSFGGMSEQKFAYDLTLDGPEKTVNFGPLVFDGRSQRVVISTSAPGLDNAWIDTDVTLVERTSQTAINSYGLVERYSGYDSDGSWTEGSDSGSVKIARVPAGTYDLVIDASAHSWPSPSFGGRTIRVETGVSSGGVFFSNLVFAIFLLSIPPLFLVWRGFKGGR